MQIIKILAAFLVIATVGIIGCGEKKAAESGTEAVSYTHLTLPTKA